MARAALAGGRTPVEVGVGKDQLVVVDALCGELGWSRAEFFRRGAAALAKAIRRKRLEGVEPEDVDEDAVDPEDAEEDLDDARTGSSSTGPIIARGASEMANGRWLGWYPQDLPDTEIVDDLRRCVPGGTVYLRRPRNPDAHVVAYIDTPETVARNIGQGAPRWTTIYPPFGATALPA